jgi:sialate O-acetylesterase
MNPFKQHFCAVLFLTAAVTFQAKAEVKFPTVFGDNMVLQQQSQVAIWGWTKANTSVKVTGSWNNKNYTTKSDDKGFWKVKIQTPEAGFTPYTLTASDGKAVTLKNVLIGEVWICSGQSNMEMPMRGRNAPIDGGVEDILGSTNIAIRCFKVEHITMVEEIYIRHTFAKRNSKAC